MDAFSHMVLIFSLYLRDPIKPLRYATRWYLGDRENKYLFLQRKREAGAS